jgi:sterol 3beta-glucosyltransferase
MRVTILAVGSRGDAQPYVALGAGLAQRGHVVTLATHEVFRGFVIQHGLSFEPLAGDPTAVVAAADRWLVTGRLRDLLPGARYFLHAEGPLFTALLADYWRAAQGADLLIYSAVAFPAWSVAERLGIPGIAACLQPLHRTREFPIIALPYAPRFSGWFNQATYTVAAQLAWQPQRGRINRWRRGTLGLAAVPRRGPFVRGQLPLTPGPTLYGYSSVVAPRPADWGGDVHVTGYWVLRPPVDWRPPVALERFLDAGPAPVYIGFGSMTPQNAGTLTALAVEALARAGQRGILLAGWGQFGAGSLPPTVFAIRDVPHEWLFPRMQAIVHHGGSGTTGTALRSGIPSVVVPLGFDQPYWARRVAELGVGADPIPRHKLKATRLAAAIHRVISDAPLRARAAALGTILSAERGVEAAVDLIERFGQAAPSE